MNKLLSKFFVVSTMMMLSYVAKADYVPFSANAFEQMKTNHQGKQWLMVLWSVDCPACFKELALIQKIKKQYHDKNLNIVIINADDNDEVALERTEILTKYQINDLPNYYFIEGEGSRSRYHIDVNWYGELPRSYFVDKKGNFHGKSGLLKEEAISEWLINSSLIANE